MESSVRLFPHLKKVQFSVLGFQFSVLASETKRRKTPQPLPRRVVASSDAKNDKASTLTLASGLQIPVAQSSGINLRIEHTKNFAVAQAQQDGCTGNYSIFDSPFANFLVPVISTRAE
ncbi:hypothetical protein G2W53_044546 [Senna tora]|uniref:Uncharacterized protein n=1 Tax=Senna tora TaxID=362788 RepID=A0A834SHP0_9FABA|nr:hypothetical protein G2W53_044546 [Senna tora]